MNIENITSFSITILKKDFKPELTKYLNTLKYEGKVYVLTSDTGIVINLLMHHDRIVEVIDSILKQEYEHIIFMINKDMNREIWMDNMLLQGYSIMNFSVKWSE